MTRCGCRTAGAVLHAGPHITVAGTGTPASPFVVSGQSQEGTATFAGSGPLTVGPGAARFQFPWPVTILGVSAAVGTAPTGSAIILDVNKNGTTIFTNPANRPTIPDGLNSTAIEAVPDVTAMTPADYLTVDRDQVGSTTPGSDL